MKPSIRMLNSAAAQAPLSSPQQAPLAPQLSFTSVYQQHQQQQQAQSRGHSTTTNNRRGQHQRRGRQ